MSQIRIAFTLIWKKKLYQPPEITLWARRIMLAAHSIYRSWLGLCAANVIRPQPPCGRSSTGFSFSTSCFDLEKKNMSDQRIRSLTWLFCRSAQKSILRRVKFVSCLLHNERWLGCLKGWIYLFVGSFISLKLVRSILDVSVFKNCSLFGKNVYYERCLGNWNFEIGGIYVT